MNRAIPVALAAVPFTQWLIAIASLASALIALALAFGLKEWIYRPRVELILRHNTLADETSDRVITKRITTGETATFVRMRIYNNGRSTARNPRSDCCRPRNGMPPLNDGSARPELDGWLLQPSNQYQSEPGTVDIVPGSDRLIDLASTECTPTSEHPASIFVEILYPWPPNRANRLEPGIWQLQLPVCGDNIPACRYFVTIAYDGLNVPTAEQTIWDHFIIGGPYAKPNPRPTITDSTTGGSG